MASDKRYISRPFANGDLNSYIQLDRVIDDLLLDVSMSLKISCQLPVHPRCCLETQHIRCII